jgi:RNA polymerase sigma factor (sigma-70 family)
MEEDLKIKIAAVVAQLNDEFGWGLTLEQQETYAVEVSRFLPGYSSNEIHNILNFYHTEHSFVHALEHNSDPNHTQAWSTVERYVRNIIGYRAAQSGSDALNSVEDETQDVLHAIYRSLPKYSYRSSFKTWMYSVTMNVHMGFTRNAMRAKRGGETITTNIDDTYPLPTTVGNPVALVEEDELTLLISSILSYDPQMQQVFLLRSKGYRPSEIERILGIPGVRIYRLIEKAVRVLQKRPEILEWFNR